VQRFLALAFGILLWWACGGDDPAPEPAAQSTAAARISDAPHDTAVLAIADLGEIRFELLPELAPKTVENFIKLAGEGFYDGTTFHRVIPDFMVQGGDPNTRNHDPRDDGKGGPDYEIEDEFHDLPHLRGTVSMANRGRRNSAGSQFFIVHQDSPQLDGSYTAFGRVTQGIEVVDVITQVEIDKFGRYGPQNRPYPKNVVIESIKIEPAPATATGEPAPGRSEQAAPSPSPQPRR
jgi:peptidyl-prolyl cis-trans isomerase B (cyclophilin B)